MATPEVDPEEAKMLLTQSGNILKASYEDQKKIVKKLIKQIIVYNDKILIDWAFDVK